MLVDQLTGALFPIADDVKIQVEWNPATVAEYRLIGYETRALRREDFNNDKVDAGEIGAGTQVTAIYEVTRAGVGRAAERSAALWRGRRPRARPGELGFLRLRWKAPGEESVDSDRNADHRDGSGRRRGPLCRRHRGVRAAAAGLGLSGRLGLGSGDRAGAWRTGATIPLATGSRRST